MNTNALPKYRVIDSPYTTDKLPIQHEEDFNAAVLLSEMPALAVRNWSGNWCGYAGVSKSHSLYGVGYDDYESMPDVHGGVTYAGHNDKLDACVGLPNANLWWLGFDCAHSGDLTPMFPHLGGSYRNIDYVVTELFDMINFLTNRPQSGHCRL